MKMLLTLKTVIDFSLLRNILIFLIDRLYREWGYILGYGRSSKERDSVRGDLYAKQLIENVIHDRAYQYEPYMLNGNAAISYGRTSLFIGKGQVNGLSSLHRTDVCSLTEEGNRLFINLNLGAGPLTYHQQTMLRFGDSEQKVDFQASLTNIKVSFDFSVEKITGRNGFLLNFTINELNGFKLNVSGSGYDWAINLFLKFFTLVFRRIVRNLLENELEQYILHRLPKYQFPVEGTSYGNETKLKNNYEGVQNKEQLLESSSKKQSQKMLKWSGMSSFGSLHGERNSAKQRTSKDFESNLGMKKTFICSLDTIDKLHTEMNNSHFLVRSLVLCNESFKENSRNEVLELSGKSSRLAMPLNMLDEKRGSVSHLTNSQPKEIILPSSLDILDDGSVFDPNIPEMSDGSEQKYSNCENGNFETSLPTSSFENNQPFLSYERREKGKSEMQDFSDLLRVASRDESKNASEAASEEAAEVASEEAAEVASEEAAEVASELKPSLRKTGTFNLTQNLDSERWKSQMEYLEKMFNGKKRKENKDLSENHHVSIEGCYCSPPKKNFSTRELDLESRASGIFQNKSPLSCTVDEFEKQLNSSADDFWKEHERKIDNANSILGRHFKNLSRNLSFELPDISNPADMKVDILKLLNSNLIFERIEQKRLDLEFDNKTMSLSPQFSKNRENEKNKRISYNFSNVCSEESNEHLKTEGYIADNVSPSEDLISFDSSVQKIDLSFETSKNSYKKGSQVETDYICEQFTESTSDAQKMSSSPKIMEDKLDPPYYVTNSLSPKHSQLEELACLNKKDTECTDSEAEFLSTSETRLSANSTKSSLKEKLHLAPLDDLQEEIITKARKLVSGLASEPDPS